MNNHKNTRLLTILLLVVALMIGAAYAAVPLYSLFCKATGFGGTTQRADVAPKATKNRIVTVYFNANVDQGLPWDFEPEVHSMQVRLGEAYTMKYKAHNKAPTTITGTATYNVQPDRAGTFFNKIQCFCFTLQTLKPDQTEKLPVQFFVDPALADDPKYADISEITLSYTFFRAKNQSKSNQ